MQFRLFLSSLALVLLVGCAGYQLGPSNGMSAGAQSIQVNYFKNETLEPRLVEAVNSALRKELQQDGTYRLATHGEGDIVVNGTITSFQRSGVSFQPGDIQTIRDYSLSITARIEAKDTTTGKVVLNREVWGRAVIRAGSDLVSAERQAVPVIAEELARNATGYLADGIW